MSVRPDLRPHSDRISPEWPVWRVAAEYRLDPIAVDREWTIEQVLDANEALDLAADAEGLRDHMRQASRAAEEQVRSLRGGRMG